MFFSLKGHGVHEENFITTISFKTKNPITKIPKAKSIPYCKISEISHSVSKKKVNKFSFGNNRTLEISMSEICYENQSFGGRQVDSIFFNTFKTRRLIETIISLISTWL